VKVFFVPSDTLKEVNNFQIQSVNIEIEDFLSFQEILIRAIEQLNNENYIFNSKRSSLASVEIIESSKEEIALNNLEIKKNEKKIILKTCSDLYKIRIGKKKTGLPNFDYPPINSNNKLKNSKFNILSIEFDQRHLENIEINSKNNILFHTKECNDNFINNKGNNLNEKLINDINNDCGDMQFSSTLDDERDLRFIKRKKCCDNCLIF